MSMVLMLSQAAGTVGTSTAAIRCASCCASIGIQLASVWQATMGHSLAAPPMCVVAVLLKVCERNSRSLRTTTAQCTNVHIFLTSKPFDLEFKGKITQKVFHLKHVGCNMDAIWAEPVMASPFTWRIWDATTMQSLCNHINIILIINSSIKKILIRILSIIC